MLRPISLGLLFALVLAACGDDSPGPFDPGGDPTAAVHAGMKQAMDKAMAVEIDDDLLEQLLAAHEAVLANEDDPRAAMNAATAHSSLSWMEYVAAHGKWQMMVEATRATGGSGGDELEEFDKRTAELRDQLASAKGKERERLSQLIKTQDHLRQVVVDVDAKRRALQTGAVAAIVKKWGPRFDALEAKYDN